MWRLIFLVSFVAAGSLEGPSQVIQISSAAATCGGLEYGKICQMDFSTTIDMIPNVKDEGTCQAECQQTGGCSHFTFHISAEKPSKTSCVLLNSCNATSACSDNPGCKHAVFGPGTPAMAEACCYQFHQKACKGQIIGMNYKIASPEQCQSFCLETPQFKFFTQYNGDFCFLHSSCDETEPCSVCTTGPASPSLDQCQVTGPQETLLMVWFGLVWLNAAGATVTSRVPTGDQYRTLLIITQPPNILSMTTPLVARGACGIQIRSGDLKLQQGWVLL